MSESQGAAIGQGWALRGPFDDGFEILAGDGGPGERPASAVARVRDQDVARRILQCVQARAGLAQPAIEVPQLQQLQTELLAIVQEHRAAILEMAPRLEACARARRMRRGLTSQLMATSEVGLALWRKHGARLGKLGVL